MKALVALYQATAREFLRDRMAILFTVLLPLLMAGFFGLIFRGEPPIQTANGPVSQAQLYVPGMLALAILWLGIFGVAPPLVQMREQQILRRLGATPLPRVTVLGAQVGWRLTTGLLQAAVLVSFGMLAYQMRIQGNVLLVLAAVILGAAVLISMGFLLAGLARSNESAVALGQVVQFPMMFLSGTLFPLEMLPEFMRPVSYAMPLTYLSDALKQTMLGTPPLLPLWLDFAVLGGCVLLFGAMAVRFFRWE